MLWPVFFPLRYENQILYPAFPVIFREVLNSSATLTFNWDLSSLKNLTLRSLFEESGGEEVEILEW